MDGVVAQVVVPRAMYLDALALELTRPLEDISNEVTVRCVDMLSPNRNSGLPVPLSRLLAMTPRGIADKVLFDATREPLRTALQEAEFDDEMVRQLGLVHRSMKKHIVPRLKTTRLYEGDMMRFVFSEPVIVSMKLLGTEG